MCVGARYLTCVEVAVIESTLLWQRALATVLFKHRNHQHLHLWHCSLHVLSRQRREPFDCHTQKLICSYTPTQAASALNVDDGGGCGGGQVRSNRIKSRHFTDACACLFVHPLLCEANTSPRMIFPFSNVIWTLEVAFEISTEAFNACSENQTEGNFTCKRSDCYLLLPALLFLIQASLFTQSQMLQGLPDPPPLYPTLMKNHMTSMLTHLLVLILHTPHFHQLLHRIQ